MSGTPLEAIVAVYAGWGIGENGTQPLTLKADRRRFRELTEGAAVIVGRKTLADFPGGRPLKDRANIVLTRQDITIEGAAVVRSVGEALAEAEKYERAFVIGGESVYKVFFPHISRIYLTKIDAAPHSDVFFPDLDADPGWYISDPGTPAEEDGIPYRFMIYARAEVLKSCCRKPEKVVNWL